MQTALASGSRPRRECKAHDMSTNYASKQIYVKEGQYHNSASQGTLPLPLFPYPLSPSPSYASLPVCLYDTLYASLTLCLSALYSLLFFDPVLATQWIAADYGNVPGAVSLLKLSLENFHW
jgi:hypothetical protein